MRPFSLWLPTATVLVTLAACRPVSTRESAALIVTPVAAPTPLVLALDQGERRLRRSTTGLTAPFIIKVDGRNGGSSDLMMGYEDIPPGKSIAPHQHLLADEIVFVHGGSGIVELDGKSSAFEEGATIYIPRRVRVAFRNTGNRPLSIVFVFSKPGFEQYLREVSVPEGQLVIPLLAEERRAIAVRHQWHTVYEQP